MLVSTTFMHSGLKVEFTQRSSIKVTLQKFRIGECEIVETCEILLHWPISISAASRIP